MLVAVYYNNKDVRVEERPVPKIGPGEILMKTMACGICGSDVMEWYRIKKAPRVLGHEATGVIVEVGEGVTQYKVGDRIFASHHVPCNQCRYCLNGHHTACETLHTTNFDPGGFSQYIRVPKINVERGILKLPDNVSFEEGTFIEPLGCVVRGQRIAGVKQGQTVLVLGSGPSGLLHIQLAKVNGAEKVIATDIDEYRMKTAEKFGADIVINGKEDVPTLLKEANEGRGADVVIVCTGALPAVHQAWRSVDKGGTILFFAVPPPNVEVTIPINDFWRNEVKAATSYGAAPMDLKESLKLIAAKKINVKDMITHKLPIQEAQLGFQLVAQAKNCIKVIIEPNKTKNE